MNISFAIFFLAAGLVAAALTVLGIVFLVRYLIRYNARVNRRYVQQEEIKKMNIKDL